MLYLKHPAWLWLKKHEPSKLPPVDEATQALFDSGHKFEPFAEALFPEGVSLGFTDYDEYKTLPKRTQDAIASGAKVLFQPRFEWQNFTCICDIVSFVAENVVDLYEIKATTRAKLEHEYDLAFQASVLEGTGLKVRNIYVIHVDNQYVRRGEIEHDKITKVTDVTRAVSTRRKATRKSMPMALEVANLPKMPSPSPDFAGLGSKPDWLKIYAGLVPQEPVVYPADVAPVIDRTLVTEFLDDMEYPLYFLDYETLMSLIPYFDGHRPYQQVPFQYSLHVIHKPGGKPQHREYLHKTNSDPARPLVRQLIRDIGTHGTVLVWYAGFEKARNSEMATMLPGYRQEMDAINERIVDLMVPFQKKWYEDPRFEGSVSIKKVLPVLCPELSYKSLGIQEGAAAQRLWMEAVLDETRRDEKDQILSDLTEYCKLDTLAMVEIYNKLRKAVNS